jgi:hypothetical protein
VQVIGHWTSHAHLPVAFGLHVGVQPAATGGGGPHAPDAQAAPTASAAMPPSRQLGPPLPQSAVHTQPFFVQLHDDGTHLLAAVGQSVAGLAPGHAIPVPASARVLPASGAGTGQAWP